jgi:hypothetical protein
VIALTEPFAAGDTLDFVLVPGSLGDDVVDATTADLTIRPVVFGDMNFDGCVDRADLTLLVDGIRRHVTLPAYDLNADGNVNIADARFLVLHFSNPGGAPCD